MIIKINLQKENSESMHGVTLEERAKLILLTLGQNAEEIKKAYRKMAFKHHPDVLNGNQEKFKLVNEAYEILMHNKYPKRIELSLLANDELVMDFTGRKIVVLDFIKQQKEFQEYENWSKNHFYGVGVL
jgi:hypothetical protein